MLSRSPDACKYGGEGGDLHPKYAQIYRILALNGKTHPWNTFNNTRTPKVYKTPHMVWNIYLDHNSGGLIACMMTNVIQIWAQLEYNTKSSTFKWTVYVNVCCSSLKVSSRCFKWILAVPTSHCQCYMLPPRCDLPLLAPKTPAHGILGPHHGMWHLCCYGDARERWEDG